MARHWARRFDANAMLALRAAINRFDARDQLKQAQAHLMYVLCRTDGLFPPSIASETLNRWPNSSGSVKYVEIDSNYGHFASSLDAAKWSADLEVFLNS